MSHTSTKYIGRFAPSPTGPLHFGSLVAAVASYLDARAHGGTWRVRIEDVDTTRCKAPFADEILRTLAAFGFAWDGEVSFQSRRIARYQAALDQLSARKLTYACSCSRKEIADSTLAGIDGPVYPGTCRHKALAADGNAIRVLTTPAEIRFVDRVQGECRQALETEIGDFVLRRRDGLFAYQLAVVVDDADQGVNRVVRGADLLDSTARQIHLQQLLNLSTPEYLHFPVVTNAAGQKLSKQTLAPAISAAEACKLLRAALVHLGQSLPPDTGHSTPSALLAVAARHWNAAVIPRRQTSHIS
jgi:glutamyl-Q tRNA(Asp) synthetase